MNKAIVCRIANRIGRDVSRHAVFVQAWAIVKAGTLELAVRGVTFGNRQEALRRLAAYNPADVRAVLVPELENPADSRAVAALGGQLPALRVVSGTWGRANKTTFGARVRLGCRDPRGGNPARPGWFGAPGKGGAALMPEE